MIQCVKEINRRILIIDDTASIHQDFGKALQGAPENLDLVAEEEELFGESQCSRPKINYQVDSAMQGKIGLDKVAAAVDEGNPYAVAFVDMRMPPGWDGVQTITHLWEKDPNLQVVICTAYSDYSWEQIIQRLGMNDRMLILKKPFDAAEVAQLALALTEKWNITRQANSMVRNLEKIVEDRTNELQHAATHDKLTGLANRSRIESCLVNVITDYQTTKHKYAVMFMDLDRFKIINDSLGHKTGDQLLKEISHRITNTIEELKRTTHQDCTMTPGRLGGDEFVLLVQYTGDQSHVIEVATRMLEEIRKPYLLSGRECHTTTSIGITFGEFDYEDPLDVLRDSDAAMYRAKSDGKDQYVCFDQSVHDAYMDRLLIEEELRIAVDDHSILMHYQPIVDLRDGRVLGFEALVRWHHSRMGNITPDRFIPIAEETGLIIPLGKQILIMAVKQIVAWQKQFAKPLTMNINLSKRQIIEPDLVQWVGELLKEYKPIPGTVKIEVTESVIMDAPDIIAPTLHQLRDLNIPICMDDFGTGHSSLHCLNRFPVDVLKIDRAFISNMAVQRNYSAVVYAILTLAQNMNVQVVAEGMETQEQLAQLQALDCDAAQGWYFARDLNVCDATELLQKGGSMAVDLNEIYQKKKAALLLKKSA